MELVISIIRTTCQLWIGQQNVQLVITRDMFCCSLRARIFEHFGRLNSSCLVPLYIHTRLMLWGKIFMTYSDTCKGSITISEPIMLLVNWLMYPHDPLPFRVTLENPLNDLSDELLAKLQ